MESGGPSSTNHESSHQVSLDIEKLAKSVKKELQISNPFSDTCCIYKVPERLRELNEKAYTPRVVSIGPIHHGNEKLKAMEDQKRMYLQEFLDKFTNVSVERFIELIKEKETRLRHCYAETNGFSSECFIKMILMDAAFVIMYLLKCKNTDLRGRDSIFYRPYKWFDVRVDICLLENQLPFFILEELYRPSTIFGDSPKPTLIELTNSFFSNEWESWTVGKDLGRVLEISEVKHLVDFLTIYHRPTEQRPNKKCEVLTAPSVKALHQAGVKFVLSSSKHLLDIKFDRSKGRLEIPRLRLEDRTEIIIRNMQAFEQCHVIYDYVGDYIFLMSLFVSASKDVEILVENRIIDHVLSSNEEVVKLFYNLQKENLVQQDGFLFEGLIKDLNAFCERPCNKRKATLKQDYFNTPWATLSVLGAVSLLILTVLQSVCSILQVV